MNFESNKGNLEHIFKLLKLQSFSTAENWSDRVQARFYEQFINSLPRVVSDYLEGLSVLDKSFESAESIIENL